MDPFAKSLLTNTRELKAVLSNDEFGLRQEVDQSARTVELLADLENTLRSLDQYTRSERDLRYIGIVGHYSAGKSSTINSLLGQEVRDTDWNPTDLGVTYLSHEDNRKKILAAESKGDLKVDVNLMKNEVLRNSVVLDTPGTGDPSQVGAMVKDILPLASIILYILSATNPFDESDVPSMNIVFQDLGHIPIKFVITRSDEFRFDASKPLNDENFDIDARDKFGATVTARLRKEGFGEDLNPDDLIYIDNRWGYGVDKLRDLAFEAELDTAHIHLRTLKFYFERVARIRTEFLAWSEKIATSVNGLLDKATTNRDKFDERTSISTGELSKWWSDNHGELKRRFEEDEALLESWAELGFEDEAESFAASDGVLDNALTEFRDRLVGSLTIAAEDFATEAFKRHVRRKIELYDEASSWRDFDESTNWDDLNSMEIVASDDVRSELRSLAETLDNYWVGLREGLLESNLCIQKIVGEFNELLKLNTTIRSEAGRFTSYQSTLNTVVDNFQATVQLYRTAVLSYRTRELTSEVSVGKALDELDELILSEDQREEILDEFSNTIFADREHALAAYESMRGIARSRVGEVLIQVQGLDENVRSLSMMLPTRFEVADVCEAKVNEKELEQSVMNSIRRALTAEAANLNQKVADSISLQAEARDAENADRLQRRANLVNLIVFGVFILGGAASFALWVTDLSSWLGNVTSYTLTAAMSVVAPGMVAEIGRRWKSKQPTEQGARGKQEVKKVLMNVRDECSIKLDEAEVDQGIESQLIRDIQTECETAYAGSVQAFASSQAKITACSKEIEGIASEHDVVHRETSTKLLGWYTPSNEKDVLLQEMATSIKERSIEPSFEVLRQKKSEIDSAVEQIQRIDAGFQGKLS